MAKMLEGLKTLYTGEKSFTRQLTLFSICGIVGLLNAFIQLEKNSLVEVSVAQKVAFLILWILFAWFITGYEVLFLRERHIPDIDMRSFKIVLNKVLFFVFVASLLLGSVAMFFPKYTLLAFWVEMCLGVPLTMLQAGFSYNFQESDVDLLFAKFGIKEYFILTLKRLWVVMLSYLSTFLCVFMIFFVMGFVYGFAYGILTGETFTSNLMMVSSLQTTIIKLSNFIASILLTYFLSVGTLVWDYELIKTYEREV